MADYTLSAKITADGSGFTKTFKQVESNLKGISKSVSDAGKRMQNIGGRMTGLGNSLTSKITKPAVAATSALVGITLVKGFQRLAGIDTARAKLQGLGHDGEAVGSIMDSALDSVRGTAFGMDEAATTAANAVAAGIPLGQDLTRYLSLTGDAAAIAGSSMSEMGSIINKVTTQNKAYNGELQQLSDRGLPIYGWLAEEAGVAEEAVSELASKGQISSAMLLNAIENNIGGAAKIMGETSFTAALANIGAAIGRIGALFLDAGGEGGGFFSTIKPMLADFITTIDNLGPVAEEMGIKFGNAFNTAIEKVKEVKSWFDNLDPSVQSLILKVAGIGSAFAVGIGPALKILGPFVAGFGSLLTVVGKIGIVASGLIGVFIGLAAWFGYLMVTNEEFRTKMLEIWGQVSAWMIETFETVKPIVQDFIQSAIEGFQNVASFIVEHWPTIQAVIIDVFHTIADIWLTVLKPVFDNIIDLVVNAVVPFVVSAFQNVLVPAIQIAWELIKTLWNSVLKPVFEGIMPVIEWLVDGAKTILPHISEAFSDVVSGIKTLWDTVLKPVFEIVKAYVEKGLVPSFSRSFEMIKEVVSVIFTSIGNMWNNSLKPIFTGIIDFLSGVFTGNWSKAWEGLVSIVSGIFGGIVEIVKAPINGVISLINGFLRGLNRIKVPDWVPGVGGRGINIPTIPYLYRGTDDWAGGFARMNEGGRGELVNLPGGTQVIPHDVSMRYARESARQNAQTNNTTIINEGREERSQKQPVHITLELGARSYTKFIEDIDEGLARRLKLEERYGRV